MVTLPPVFQKNGFSFTQVKRVENLAIFEKRKDNSLIFEVVRIVISLKGELYPTPEKWGMDGFSTPSLEKAEEWLNKLLESPYRPMVAILEGLTTKPKKRGRKPSEVILTFPATEFTVKEVADSNKVTISFVHNHLKVLIKSGQARFVKSEKTTKGRGKSSNFYALN